MKIASWFLALFALISFSELALAKDSTELYEFWRKYLETTSFYCPSGRAPIANSGEAWAIKPTADCTFKGPLDTKINPLKLEAPILNPLLTLSGLKSAVQQLNLPVQSEGAGSLSFRLPNGASLNAAMIEFKQMQDPLFHLRAIPLTWGTSFISITARQTADIADFISLAQSLPADTVFWKNPHFAEEQKVWPRFQLPRTYKPLPLLSKCGGGGEWKSFGSARRSLLLVGDTHDLPEMEFFQEILKSRKFAWVGLEIPYDLTPVLQNFLKATGAAEEAPHLTKLTERFPKGIIVKLQENLRLLKSLQVPVVLYNSLDEYFNFPFTNVAFHGAILGARNYVWVQRLPADWSGTAVMLGGHAHFLQIPGAGFQDFALERYPGLEMGLIYPLEKCGAP